jgi:hypothetical protein
MVAVLIRGLRLMMQKVLTVKSVTAIAIDLCKCGVE